MSIKVFIDGGEGTTGLRLAQRLESRLDVQLLSIDPELRKDPVERGKVSDSADVVFLCLPDAAAREAVAHIQNPKVVVIDASTAHRTAEGWSYGLPELSAAHREGIRTAKRIAVPGCHATGFTLAAYPLVKEGIVSTDYPFTCHSVTGYSGGGKQVIAQYGANDRAGYFTFPRQYALGQQHKHLPEMEKVSGLLSPPVFNPIIGDYYAGMMVTVPLHTRLMNKPVDAQALYSVFADYYKGQALVSVKPYGSESEIPGGMLNPGAYAGLDRAELYICGNGDRIILCALFDNLGKGASGAAVQCMNINQGLEETAGLAL